MGSCNSFDTSDYNNETSSNHAIFFLFFSWKLVEHQRFFVYSQSSAKIPHRMRSWSVCSEAQFHYKNTVKCMIEHQKHIRDEDARFFSCLKACVRGDFYCEPAGKEWHYLRIKISFCIYDASTPPPAAPPKFLSRLKSCSNWASFTFLLVINCIQIYIHQRFQTLFSVV